MCLRNRPNVYLGRKLGMVFGLTLSAAAVAGCNNEMGGETFGPGGTGAPGLLNGGFSSFVTQPGGFADVFTMGGFNQGSTVFSPTGSTSLPPAAFTGGSSVFTSPSTIGTGGSGLVSSLSAGTGLRAESVISGTSATGIRPTLVGSSTVAGSLTPGTLTGSLTSPITAGSPFSTAAFNNFGIPGLTSSAATAGLSGTSGSAITGLGTGTFGSSTFGSNVFGP